MTKKLDPAVDEQDEDWSQGAEAIVRRLLPWIKSIRAAQYARSARMLNIFVDKDVIEQAHEWIQADEQDEKDLKKLIDGIHAVRTVMQVVREEVGARDIRMEGCAELIEEAELVIQQREEKSHDQET